MKRSTCTSSTIRKRLGLRSASSARSPKQKRDRDHRDHDHQQRRQLRLTQPEDDRGVGAQEAEENPPAAERPKLGGTNAPAGEPPFQSRGEGKDQGEKARSKD